jgi:hypothetical protein
MPINRIRIVYTPSLTITHISGKDLCYAEHREAVEERSVGNFRRANKNKAKGSRGGIASWPRLFHRTSITNSPRRHVPAGKLLFVIETHTTHFTTSTTASTIRSIFGAW